MHCRRIAALVSVCALVFLSACAGSRVGSDAAWWDAKSYMDRPPTYDRVVRTSRYLTMRDGVRIAIDLYLPEDLKPGDKLPTILMQTRYFRFYDLHWPLGAIAGIPDEIKTIVRRGYAIVRADVRGSGASFGWRPYPWSDDEIKDGGEIVDWIVTRDWSSGVVGAAGGSYEGTTSEFLLVNENPAVKAIIPAYALYDVYTDIAFPGGIHLEWFTRTWQKGNGALDKNRVGEAAWYADFLISGVAPVDEPEGKALLKEAVADHALNYHVHEAAQKIVFRDDTSIGGVSTDTFSPHAYKDAEKESGAAIYNYSGWFDGGYPHAAVKRFLTNAGPADKLILGPWDHGGDDRVVPLGETRRTRFDHLAEMGRFFDLHLRGTGDGLDAEAPVHYFTMGEDRWKSAQTWPPPGAVPMPVYFGADQTLTRDEPVVAGADIYRVDRSAGTGDHTRWNSLAVGLAVSYPDRALRDKKLLVYQSEPLEADLEVTGHPIAHVWIESDSEDAQLFVYLEDVDELDRVGYVTEGMLRALHRKLSDKEPPYRTPAPYHTFKRADAMLLVPGEPAELVLDMLPVSYLFKKGHRIRIAVSGADSDLFRVLDGDPPLLTVLHEEAYPSRVVLPVMPRADSD